MLVDTLVSNAIYGAGLQDQQLEGPIAGGIQSIGLDFLNLLFDEWRSRIPYASQFNFDNYLDLEDTKFVNVDNVEFVFPGQTVQYPLIKRDLKQWNLETTVIGLTGIPRIYYFDPQYQSILIYPIPIQPTYSFIVWGRPAMGPLELGQNIPPQVPTFMVSALTRELSYRMAAEYGVPFSDDKKEIKNQSFNNLNSQQVVAMSPTRNIAFRQSGSKVGFFPWFYYLSGGSN